MSLLFLVESEAPQCGSHPDPHLMQNNSLPDEVVALKRLKMENEKEGFPITSLREINTLMKAQHPNIVTVRVSTTLRNDGFGKLLMEFQS